LHRKVNTVMRSEEANEPRPPQPQDDRRASPVRPGRPAQVLPSRRLRHDAGVFVLMLAAGAAAVAVDVNLYSTLESKVRLCLPR
jgi:hypothetical protein